MCTIAGGVATNFLKLYGDEILNQPRGAVCPIKSGKSKVLSALCIVAFQKHARDARAEASSTVRHPWKVEVNTHLYLLGGEGRDGGERERRRDGRGFLPAGLCSSNWSSRVPCQVDENSYASGPDNLSYFRINGLHKEVPPPLSKYEIVIQAPASPHSHSPYSCPCQDVVFHRR
jgi:hypothetical protein